MDSKELTQVVLDKDYFNFYDASKNYAYAAIRAGYTTQSQEINEIQNICEHKIQALGRTLYRDGQIISGGAMTHDAAGGNVHIDAAQVFVDGIVYDAPEATLVIPANTNARVGVWFLWRRVTPDEDERLLNPAKNTAAYRLPGAFRVKTWAEFGLADDADNMAHGKFYALYQVVGEDKTQMLTEVHPELTPDYLKAIAQYDAAAHANYICDGLRVTALAPGDDVNEQAFSISKGVAHINGYQASLACDLLLNVNAEPQTAQVLSEPHVFNASNAKIALSQTPVVSIDSVRVTKSATVDVTHGAYAGCTDNLPSTSVIKIVSVTQNGVSFLEHASFELVSNTLDWSLNGVEPQPGSKYVVSYEYRTDVAPDAFDEQSVTLSGLVDDSFAEIDYTFKLKRIDKIILRRNGTVELIRGVSHRFNPVEPDTPSDSVCLATVSQDWRHDAPAVANTSIKAVRMSDLNEMRRQIENLYSLVTRSELKINALANAPSASFGVFTDPLLDDDLRDDGERQTAEIYNATLGLAMNCDVLNAPTSGQSFTLEPTEELLLEQNLAPSSLKINAYNAFEPLPASVILSPAVDRYQAEKVNQRMHDGYATHDTTTEHETSHYDYHQLRELEISVFANGFDAYETLTATFAGLPVALTPNFADKSGAFRGAFKIPAGVPSGDKLFVLHGAQVAGRAVYSGTAVARYLTRKCDPVAQTFVLESGRFVTAAEIFVKQTGSSRLGVELRTTSLGVPEANAIAQVVCGPETFVPDSWNRVAFDRPVWLDGGVEYALVLKADTSDWLVGVARVGDFVKDFGYIYSQPYANGVLLSSSNASTWTEQRDADLAFKIVGARFEQHSRLVDLAELDLTGKTDVMPLAEVQHTSPETEVSFILRNLATGEDVARMQNGQVVRFDEPLAGKFKFIAQLFGDDTHSPVLVQDPQLATAALSSAGVYVSRAFACGKSRRVMVTLEERLPSGSSLRVFVETQNGWTQQIASAATPIGDEFWRRQYCVPCSRDLTRLKLELAGTSDARPEVKNISAVILAE